MQTRLFLGVLILTLLLALCLSTSFLMRAIHQPIGQQLSEAAELALGDQPEEGMQLARQAYVRWQTYHSVTASFADHNPMDDTDTLFQEMLIYGQTAEIPHFAACCRQLAVLTQAMYDAHRFSLKNLL